MRCPGISDDGGVSCVIMGHQYMLVNRKSMAAHPSAFIQPGLPVGEAGNEVRKGACDPAGASAASPRQMSSGVDLACMENSLHLT